MTTVVPLQVVQAEAPEVDEDLVQRLEHALVLAKAGELTCHASAYVMRDGSKTTGWNGLEGTRDTLTSAIAMLYHRYVDALLERD